MKNSNVRLFSLMALVIYSFCFWGCEKEKEDVENGDNPPEETSDVLKFLNVMDAKYLYIAEPNQLKSSASDTMNTLFKVTEDGVVQEVSYLNEDSVLIQLEKQPYKVDDVNENFMIVSFAEPPDNMGPESYLVRKNDGAVFILTSTPIGEVFTDKNENLIFESHSGINKINTQNPDNITSEEIVSSNTEEISNLVVDSEGNLFYSDKIKYVSGGLRNVENLTDAYSQYWLGLDDNFYYVYPSSEFHYYNFINSIEITNSQATEVFYDSLIADATSFPMGGTSVMAIAKFPDLSKIIFLGVVVSEVYNTEGEVKYQYATDFNGMTTIDMVAWSDANYYLVGKNASRQPFMVKVNPSSFPHTSSVLIDPNLYEIYKLSVSGDDEILFNALRMADGKKVVGKIPSSGGDPIILEEISNVISVLIRVQ